MRTLRQLGGAVCSLFLLSFLLFALLHFMPGSAGENFVSGDPDVRATDLDRWARLGGLDRSVFERYGCWLFGRTESRCAYWTGAGVLFGDLGWSRTFDARVSDLLVDRLETTLSMTVPAFLLALFAAWTLGTRAAFGRRGSGVSARILALTGSSIPTYSLALIFAVVFGVRFGWIGASGPRSFVLPICVLAFVYGGRWVRHVQVAVADALAADYVVASRARGLSEDRVLRIVARNAAAPVLVIVASSIPSLFGGALVIERVFSLPGVGLLIFDSLMQREPIVAVTVLVFYALVTSLTFHLVDFVQARLDPRVRVES